MKSSKIDIPIPWRPKVNDGSKNDISILSLRNLLVLIFVFLVVDSFGQNNDREKLDSIYNVFISLRNNSGKSNVDRIMSENPADVKCGFGLVNEIKSNFNLFTPEQQLILNKLLQRPIKQKSIVTASGFFRINYDTTGGEAPVYDIGLLANALDSAYNFEVGYLGFPPPPKDSEGEDDLYDVYISALGLYGYTIFSSDPLDHSSYIEIDNRMNFFTKGIDAARATVAHEFHHAIQIGNYGFRDEDLFFYELTSTSMEEFVFDEVNDYYNYLPTYFNNTQHTFSFSPNVNDPFKYSMAIWNIFLKERFGFGIFKRQWELMPQMRALNAINTSIIENGSSFRTELSTFGIWTYFTNYRFDKGVEQGFYFEEGKSYPAVRLMASINFTPPKVSVNITSKPAANTFLKIYNSIQDRTDTIYVILTNADVVNGVNNLNKDSTFTYSLFNYFNPGSIQLSQDYFTSTSSGIWNKSEVLNFQLIQGSLALITIDNAFPSPFYYKKEYQTGSFIRIPVKTLSSPQIDFNVYTVAMELVYSQVEIADFNLDINQYVVKWNALNNKNERLPTGVYIYVIKSGDEIIKGKIAIFNE